MIVVLFLGAASLVAALGVLWSAVSASPRQSTAAAHLMQGLRDRVDLRDAVLAGSFDDRALTPLLRLLGRCAGRLTPKARVERLGERIVRAGSPRGLSLEKVLAAKAVLAIAFLAIGGLRLLGSPSAAGVLFAIAIALFGFFLPDILVANATTHRKEVISLALADTTDQMMISVEAGLGLEAAMARVSEGTTGPLAYEFRRTLQDIRAGLSRNRALHDLAERVDVPDLRRLVMAILQADTHGISIADTLRIQSNELRIKRRQLAEERALKLPVKLLFPTALCMLPALFTVILAPAVINIIDTLGG
jgi:tight adherence protein C